MKRKADLINLILGQRYGRISDHWLVWLGFSGLAPVKLSRIDRSVSSTESGTSIDLLSIENNLRPCGLMTMYLKSLSHHSQIQYCVPGGDVRGPDAGHGPLLYSDGPRVVGQPIHRRAHLAPIRVHEVEAEGKWPLRRSFRKPYKVYHFIEWRVRIWIETEMTWSSLWIIINVNM